MDIVDRNDLQDQNDQCPHCDMPIYDDELLSCPFCGEQLDVSAGFISGLTRGSRNWLGIALALAVLAAFLYWAT